MNMSPCGDFSRAVCFLPRNPHEIESKAGWRWASSQIPKPRTLSRNYPPPPTIDGFDFPWHTCPPIFFWANANRSFCPPRDARDQFPVFFTYSGPPIFGIKPLLAERGGASFDKLVTLSSDSLFKRKRTFFVVRLLLAFQNGRRLTANYFHTFLLATPFFFFRREADAFPPFETVPSPFFFFPDFDFVGFFPADGERFFLLQSRHFDYFFPFSSRHFSRTLQLLFLYSRRFGDDLRPRCVGGAWFLLFLP